MVVFNLIVVAINFQMSLTNKIFYQKQFGSKKMLLQKHFMSRKCWVKKINIPKSFGPQKCWVQKNLADIPNNMNKCRKDKLCLYKYHCDSWYIFKMVPGTYFYSSVKFMSVTAEIFLIWTNVARTNITWANVTVTVGIC